ncbi:AAA family ATPase [Variovorax sp. J22G21]|uniref:AAA family ATPase n=1 Tax=Variovorax fucosicus TaxID=3053517 RepID=UPI002577DCF9|nr:MULTISPECIES: AAA family ATPase [unclassified Variovorax]MDM0039788.1 AAA family ATPase [Variovorax sp. J22R193]MDM0064663.1 AAA family ATPase [Variovorax sp. J22G21]
MATAEQDYVRFLRWLHSLQPAAPDHVRQFANMVLGDFEAVAETALQRNARATQLAALARRGLAATAVGMPEGKDEDQAAEWPWTRLRSLAVGPFRGFVREEVFDLQRRVVLFYGPNGAGKSSICEAIERAMLGSVEEAGLKRLDEPAYLRNIHAGRFVEPRLMATSPDRREAPVRANADLYRFCFIEKNRIDAFSRIAQRPTGQRAELIATLFGMEKFNDFCGRFNDQIDPVLVIDARKQRELRLKQEALAWARATVSGEAEKLAQHDAENEAYAAAFRSETTFARLQEIIGSTEVPGRLAELDGLLNAVPGLVIGVDRASLAMAFERANIAAEALSTTTRELQRRASQVSFRALYGAVVALEAESADRCPACETPLDRVTRDPFEKARKGVVELRELAELQERQERQRGELMTASTELHAALTKLSGFIIAQGEAATVVRRHLEELPARPAGANWWMGVYLPEAGQDDGPASLEQLLSVADHVSATDQNTRAQLERRVELAAEREGLLARQRHIDQRNQTRQRIGDDAAAARETIAAFDVTNARLIADAEQERLDILRDAPIRAAYDAFLPYLRRFKNELPGMLIAGLGDMARDLYNDFNRGDRDEDKLAHLYLPLTGEQRIQLAFRDAINRRVDALQVLSEGHIRCLGLAILLAKATNIGSPLLIFDDAVNAIDHDHRHGIKETIFAGERFLATQILVTCHSPEFIKDVKNAIPRERRGDCQEYALTHHEGDHHPRVHRDVPSSAYIDKARNDLGRFQLRDALANSRRALEMLSNKAWKWLGSHELGELRLTMHGPTSPLNVRDLCDAIRVKLRYSATFDHPSKAPLREALEEILSASNLTWKYLNGGTHEEEDRDEFDRVEVELVVSRLERIDALDLRTRR